MAKFIGMACLTGFDQLIISFTSITLKIGQNFVAGRSPLAAAKQQQWIINR